MFAENWTASNSGQKINLLNPSVDAINLADIANALSKLCRFNGQLKSFYSVAQHCVHVSELVPQEWKLQALFHDADEAYICDIPTPLKPMLGDAYKDISVRLQAVIGKKFGVDLFKLDPLVKQADRIMVVSERDQLQQVPLKWSDEYENVIRFPNKINPLAPEQAKTLFLDTYDKIVGNPPKIKIPSSPYYSDPSSTYRRAWWSPDKQTSVYY